MKKERVFIFVLIGVMVFSAIATGLLFLSRPDESADTSAQEDTSQQQVCETSPDVAAQAGQPAGEWPTSAETPVTDLQIIDLRDGTGAAAELGNCITVHYRLSLADGTPVAGNDTFSAGSGPISFELAAGSLIEGWVQGIPGLKEGGLRRLVVPASLAYGDVERPGIPAGSDLIFDVELVKIEY